tara:strand:- start:10771 stop:11262 length:492 start_codon:yes stop_codon:yes gene_type:complete
VYSSLILEIIVREALIDDLKSIQLLNKKLFEGEFDKYDDTINVDWPLSKEGEKFYEERISGSEGCAFVLVKGEEIIGYLVGSLSKDEFYRNVKEIAELDEMYILEEYRNGGHGSLLYSKSLEWCKEKGVKRLKVLVTAKNKQAINFYKKKGFDDYNVTLERDV